MTTARSAFPDVRHPRGAVLRDQRDKAVRQRQRARLARKRLFREELLAVFVLVVALAITLVLLGLQWLGEDSPSVSSAPRPAVSQHPGTAVLAMTTLGNTLSEGSG